MKLTIDGQPAEASEGMSLLEAAEARGIHVPALCRYPGLPHVTSCMVCMVEDQHTQSLVPACSTPATEGMRIATDSPLASEARRASLEMLLGDHVGDCEGPCRRGCPAAMDIPAMLRHIAAGRMRDAIRTIKEHIVLPATLGRVCPAPCEKVCRRGFHDAPVGICRLKRFAADVDLAQPSPWRPAIPGPSGFRVAGIGAGPAGLAAAAELRRRGHAVTLLEQAPAAGGGLRAAELEPKLPDRVLDAEIAEVLALGIELKTGVSLGRDLTLDEAVAGYDAVILAIGEFDPEAMRSWGLYVGKRGIEAERHTGRTAMPTVFACGNVTGPGRMAVRSLAQGRIAAIAVDRMLRGAPVTEAPRAYDHRLTGRPSETEMAVFMVDAAPDARREPDDGNAGYTEAEAQAEAARCMHCDCRKAKACKLRLYADTCGAHQHGWKPEKRRAVEMVRSGRVVYEPGKCIACGICVRLTERAREPLGLTFVGRGFDVRVRVPFDAELEQGLQRVAAECVEACPTGALAWRAG